MVAAGTLTRIVNVADSEPSVTCTVTVQVTVGSESATFTILVSVPAATIKGVSGHNHSAVINPPLSAPLVVQVQDKSGNPASFSPVFFSASGLQTLSATSVSADVN